MLLELIWPDVHGDLICLCTNFLVLWLILLFQISKCFPSFSALNTGYASWVAAVCNLKCSELSPYACSFCMCIYCLQLGIHFMYTKISTRYLQIHVVRVNCWGVQFVFWRPAAGLTNRPPVRLSISHAPLPDSGRTQTAIQLR